jgi:hypothetical protein
MTCAPAALLIVIGAALGVVGFYWLILWAFLKYWRM